MCNCHLNRSIRDTLRSDGTPWFQWKEYHIVNQLVYPYPWAIFPVYAAKFIKVGVGGVNPATQPSPSLAPQATTDVPSSESGADRPATEETPVDQASSETGVARPTTGETPVAK